MDVREIPTLLFKQFTVDSKKKDKLLIGQNEGGFWLSLEEASSGCTYLRMHEREEDTDGEMLVYFGEIVAGPRHRGMWSSAHGNMIEETIEVNIPQFHGGYPTLDIIAPRMFFLSHILMETINLVKELPFEATRGWESEKQQRKSILDQLEEEHHCSSTLASWRSGYAAVCKTVYPGSIPGEASRYARVAELVYAKDLKSFGHTRPCGFESRPGHQKK